RPRGHPRGRGPGPPPRAPPPWPRRRPPPTTYRWRWARKQESAEFMANPQLADRGGTSGRRWGRPAGEWPQRVAAREPSRPPGGPSVIIGPMTGADIGSTSAGDGDGGRHHRQPPGNINA